MPKCIYCQQDKSHRSFSIEHIIPECLGYDLKAKNLVCTECNGKLSVVDQVLCREGISSFSAVIEGKPLKKKKGKPDRLPQMQNKNMKTLRNKMDASVVIQGGTYRFIIHKDGQTHEIESKDGVFQASEEELRELFNAPDHLEIKGTIPPPRDQVAYSRAVHKIAFNLISVFFPKWVHDPFFDAARSFIQDGVGTPRKFRQNSLLGSKFNNFLLITAQRGRACFVNFIVNRILYMVSLAPECVVPTDVAGHHASFDFSDTDTPPVRGLWSFPGKEPLCTNPGSTDIK